MINNEKLESENNKEIQIIEIKNRIKDINTEVKELVLRRNHFFLDMYDNILKLRKSDFDKLEQWENNEKSSAQKQFDGESQINKNDYDLNLEKLNERAAMIIKYKFDKLVRTLPQIAKYYSQFDTPFLNGIRKIPSFPNDNLNNTNVYLTKESLLHPNYAAQDLLLVNNISNNKSSRSQNYDKPIKVEKKTALFSVTQRALKHEKNSYPVGSNLQITFPETQPINAILTLVSNQKITFTTYENTTFSVSLPALNTGLIDIKKI